MVGSNLGPRGKAGKKKTPNLRVISRKIQLRGRQIRPRGQEGEPWKFPLHPHNPRPEENAQHGGGGGGGWGGGFGVGGVDQRSKGGRHVNLIGGKRRRFQ